MANSIRFFDNMVFAAPQVSDEVKDLFMQQGQTAGQGLRVRLAATHAGRITRNNSFYPPHRVRSSASTWTDPYPKPILIHHDDSGEPIGRVYSATYVDTSNGFRDSYKKVKDSAAPISDILLDAFLSGKLSKKETIQVAADYFINNDQINQDPTFNGLGYIELIVDITDPEAIKKILDRRYMTGSIGASSNSATCSICKIDWADEDGPCEHRPGRMYDGEKCVLIPGELIYDEYSFVNKPADTLSRVLEITNCAGVRDSVAVDFGDQKEREVILICDSISEEDVSMKVLKLEDAVALLRKQNEQLGELEAGPMAQKVLDYITQEKLLEGEEVNAEEVFLANIDKVLKESAAPPSNPPVVDPVKAFFGEDYDQLVGDDPAGREYVESLYGLVEDATTDEERRILTQMVMDAKLSAKKRKGMSGSTFCGPERSFPVNDCAHYSAAKRLLGRYKGPGDKDRILACIERKGKRLGCGGDAKSKDSVNVGQFTTDYFDAFTDEELTQLRVGLGLALAERGVQVEDSSATSLKEMQEKLQVAEGHIGELQSDIENLNDSLAASVEDLRNQKIARIADYKRLSGETVELTDLVTHFSTKTVEECDTVLKDCIGSIDCVEIFEKIKSGLAKQPEGTVADPTLIQNNTPAPDTKEYDIAQVRMVYERWIEERLSRGPVAAEQLLEMAKRRGLIPRNNPFQVIEDVQS